jgi:hypothetical protein
LESRVQVEALTVERRHAESAGAGARFGIRQVGLGQSVLHLVLDIGKIRQEQQVGAERMALGEETKALGAGAEQMEWIGQAGEGGSRDLADRGHIAEA